MPDITATRPASGEPIATAWGDQVHDAIEGIQTGTVSVNITAGPTSWTVPVTFTRTYAVAPVAVATISSGSLVFWCSVENITTTGMTVRVTRKDETAQGATTTQVVQWVAIGAPA